MRFAVIPAAGIGDALIMLIASHHLGQLGHQVTTLHRQLPFLGRWLGTNCCQPLPDDGADSLFSYDAIVLQYDNTVRAQQIAVMRKHAFPVFIFYPTHHPSKHGPLLEPFDYAFNHAHTMAENCRLGVQSLFGGLANMFNGLKPPSGLIHRKYQRRVLIHPTSSDPKKNWPKEKFIHLAHLLQKRGFDPLFILSSEEKSQWVDVPSLTSPSLEDLASIIYEADYFIGNDSGPGHLASYLSIPHLIIGRDEQHMKLWRPGWHCGEIVYPPRWLPNIKGIRLRDNKWKYFISTNLVLKRFTRIIK